MLGNKISKLSFKSDSKQSRKKYSGNGKTEQSFGSEKKYAKIK